MWYREGTNSFEKGSKKVAGVGTFWSLAKYGVMPGMVLIGFDNLLYEIESVQSNTELTLVEVYKGNSIKDQPCRIITTYEGDLSQFSARFSALLHSISGDSREIRNWLTSPSPVVIVRDDGTTFKADSLETIYAAHKARIEWFDKNQTLISDAGNQAANAAGSAKAAKDSQIAAKTSETQAEDSAKAAKDSQVAASASQSAAKISETNAKTSEINAANSEKAAEASQTVTKVSETNAANSAKGANESQAATKVSETNAGNFSNAAKVSELASKTSETNAKSSEVSAKSSETNAKSSADSATEKAKQAADSQIAAKASETNAAASSDTSTKSASNASASASKAEQEANKAISSANNAATSASGAASSANSAKTSETNAKSSENNATTAEKNAKASENNAAASKSEAEKSAKDAVNTLAKMGNDAKIAADAANAAKLSETNSKASEITAKTSETNTSNAAKAAKSSQDAAKVSETNAAHSAQLAVTSQTSAKASESVAVSSKNAAQEAATLATQKAELASVSESKALDAANRATLAAQEKEDILKGKTIAISPGSDKATWTKIAEVIMPQAASTIRIELVGGSGFNVGNFPQTAMAEIVLRSGNGNPKGINASIYRTNGYAADKVATINTEDDKYDVYVHFGSYSHDLICNVQQANATILNVGTLTNPSEDLPKGVQEGKTYNYVLASSDEYGNLSVDTNMYGPGFVSGAKGQDRTWLEPKEGNAYWLANISDQHVGEFKHPKKSGTAAILEEHFTKGESDSKYALKDSQEELKVGYLSTKWVNDFAGIKFKKPDDRYAVIETTPHGGAPLNFIYRDPNGNNISVASLPIETGVIALQGYSYSKDEINQNFVKSDTTNLGKSWTALKTISSGEWGQPIGYSTMVYSDSVGLPNGFNDYGYWNVIAARDVAQGYAGFLTGFNTGHVYYGFSNTKEGNPTWVRVYTENHKPSPSELGIYSKGESDGKYQPKGDYAINQNTVPNNRKVNGKLLSSDITLNAVDVGAFRTGLTEVVSDDNVPWNALSGVYNANYGGHTQIIVHFSMGAGNTSTPSLQFKSVYKNSGIAYRSARDGYGFEEPWTEFYTTKNKPSASDVDAYSKGESDGKYQPKGNYAIAGSSYLKEESSALFAGYAKSLPNLNDRNFTFFFTGDESSGWAKGVNINWRTGGDTGQFFVDSQGKFRARFLNDKGTIAERGFLYPGDAYTKGESDSKYQTKIGEYISFGGSNEAWTTAQFIDWIKSQGAFNTGYWLVRGSWWYAGNCYISDTGVGNIHLAGCTVEVVGLIGAYTIKIITPTTSASGEVNKEFIYVNNADGTYSPGWRRLYNTSSPPTAAEVGAYAKGESDDKYQPKGSYASAASHDFSGGIRAQNVITGAVNNQSFFFQRDGAWVWTAQQGGTWQGEIKHPGRGGVFALQGDSYSKGESDGRYLPQSGGTLSGALTVNNNIRANSLTLTTTSSSWINMRTGHCLTSTGIVNNAAAAPILRQEHADRHFMVAGLGNSQFGFYMLNKGRTENGFDAGAYLSSDGTWYCNGNGNFNDVYIRSDKRSKENIEKISDAGQKLSKLSGYTYTVSDDNNNSSRSAGLIAQEVQDILPEAVTKDEKGLLRLNYNSVIGLLVESAKDLQKQVDDLKNNR
ncbi:tail fiber domain-containing protein [Xenorhabdus bovienii]|uniref:tail fiber domain-containing protein n=1 Tax=Xenorhabdus bovienii TaxID=40576 RepID=UPI003BABB8C3|nr:tail fiber domain-containing protein [Xenorhabdus bovienii]MDE9502929.1 tail fiber domain-containing protein [Xenorhabdus bovienii]